MGERRDREWIEYIFVNEKANLTFVLLLGPVSSPHISCTAEQVSAGEHSKPRSPRNRRREIESPKGRGQ
jgi:hypothetical protein